MPACVLVEHRHVLSIMNFPISFRFKLLALAPQIYVTDASGHTICYVKQKLFRFREKVEVFTDDSMQTLLATIEADRIIDWSARYTFKSPQGNVLGAIGRRGVKSLWRAHYDVFTQDGTEPVFTIQEASALVKLLDGIVGEIPIVGAFTGYMLHPSYHAVRRDGNVVVAKLTKRPAFFEGRFELEQISTANEGEELALLLSFLMMNLLERTRG